MLREAARMLASTSSFRTRFNLVEELEKLPRVGPYTARAVAAFAWNHDGVVIETNIRTAIIHHFYPKRKKVSDSEIERVLTQVLPKGRAREWYSALMDYGAHLKRSGISHNAKSSGYAKQTPLKGSLREVRGAVLKTLSHGLASRTTLQTLFDSTRRGQVRTALTALENEGFITKNRTYYALA
jgi:A/G-specific adenine glycosylase